LQWKGINITLKHLAMLHKNEISEVIDCTPTWEQIFPSMLLIFKDSKSNKDKLTVIDEFRKMANAADKWNSYCKESK
jgi:hypothetical protein